MGGGSGEGAISRPWDVVVIGAGPAGAVTALRCAAAGLRCLLLEKAALPRNKVCSGMIMSTAAQTIMAGDFGRLPKEALVPPYDLKGYAIHFPGAGEKRVEWKTPIGWRKDIDFWMVERAVARGVTLWEESRVTSVAAVNGSYAVRLDRRGEQAEVAARFLVGANGGKSLVRESLFGEEKVFYIENLRECYEGVNTRLEPGYFHAIFLPQAGLLYSAAHEKDGVLLLEMGAPMGKVREHRERVRAHLASEFGLDPEAKPKWRDACLEPLLLRNLTSKTFVPARGNALLVGDAAGFLMPLTGEGIGPALKTGVAAAGGIIAAGDGASFAGDLYVKGLDAIISGLHKIYGRVKKLDGEAALGAEHVAAGLKECWEETLRVA